MYATCRVHDWIWQREKHKRKTINTKLSNVKGIQFWQTTYLAELILLIPQIIAQFSWLLSLLSMKIDNRVISGWICAIGVLFCVSILKSYEMTFYVRQITQSFYASGVGSWMWLISNFSSIVWEEIEYSSCSVHVSFYFFSLYKGLFFF